MDRASDLIQAYRDRVERPWRRDISGPEKVWIAVYPPEIERRIRARVEEFGLETTGAGKRWAHLDLTSAFATWMGGHPRRDAYFARPALIGPAYAAFASYVEDLVRDALTAPEVDQDTVVAISGAGTIYPMLHVSALVSRVVGDIRGRLLILFPGSLERGNYRLLDARDGWNYLAVPITIEQGAS